MLYRILTENKNRAEIESIVANLFDGFTLINGKGYWHGQEENSLIIEIDTQHGDKVREAARRIKATNNQQAVMVQRIAVETVLI